MVVPDPDEKQLADIAISTADNHRKLTGEEPFIAMLSFSTKGSASKFLYTALAHMAQVSPLACSFAELIWPIAGNAKVEIITMMNSFLM